MSRSTSNLPAHPPKRSRIGRQPLGSTPRKFLPRQRLPTGNSLRAKPQGLKGGCKLLGYSPPENALNPTDTHAGLPSWIIEKTVSHPTWYSGRMDWRKRKFKVCGGFSQEDYAQAFFFGVIWGVGWPVTSWYQKSLKRTSLRSSCPLYILPI